MYTMQKIAIHIQYTEPQIDKKSNPYLENVLETGALSSSVALSSSIHPSHEAVPSWVEDSQDAR